MSYNNDSDINEDSNEPIQENNIISSQNQNVVEDNRNSNSLALVRQYTFISFYDINHTLNSSFENSQSFEKTNVEINILSQRFCSINNLYDENSCRICLCEFEPTDVLSKIDICNHIFHNACIIEWGSYKTTCPTCRTEIDRKK